MNNRVEIIKISALTSPSRLYMTAARSTFLQISVKRFGRSRAGSPAVGDCTRVGLRGERGDVGEAPLSAAGPSYCGIVWDFSGEATSGVSLGTSFGAASLDLPPRPPFFLLGIVDEFEQLFSV